MYINDQSVINKSDMSKAKKIIKEALELPILERAEIAEKLLQSLDEPDETIDQLWRNEVEDRIRAYNQGKIETVTVNEVMDKYSKR
jgi:putative addiction module component (TIGR02574 family)